jgi:uncharacterized protein (DUF58 family)
VAPDDCQALFERSVTLVASLVWHLSEKSYPLRLLVDAEDSGLGSGTDHLVTMLRMLALCERRPPISNKKLSAEPLFELRPDAERGYTVAVMAWSDPTVIAPPAVDRILHAPHIEALTHDF